MSIFNSITETVGKVVNRENLSALGDAASAGLKRAGEAASAAASGVSELAQDAAGSAKAAVQSRLSPIRSVVVHLPNGESVTVDEDGLHHTKGYLVPRSDDKPIARLTDAGWSVSVVWETGQVIIGQE